MPALRPRRSLHAQTLYLWALVRRFHFTFAMLFLLVGGGGTLLWFLFRRNGTPIPYSRAVVTAYFLLFAQTITDLPDSGWIFAVYVLIPPLGIVTVAEGFVRFAFLFFAKHRDDKEWFAVLAQTLQDHVIVCGAGRVGYRVFEQFLKLEVAMVVIEKDAAAPFVSTIRDAGVPVLIEDVRSSHALDQANIKKARAIVCATDDDLANLNIALDARRMKPGIRVVMRLFDDDLVAKVREVFEAEAFSTSALAAPALAVAALDASIRNSFEVGGRLMVIAEQKVDVALADKTVGDLRAEGLTVMHLVKADGRVHFDPPLHLKLDVADTATVQATHQSWQGFRARWEKVA